ncbi:hypothetical protein GCM10008119_26890 [Pedobacter mendelii]|uniref:Uncharacterized protein n=1 Tax=Pedobacter mendelii TaxID=1908240 RepID=A0ABQ2BMW6_9SPHI|nr:hypothetical protein GCM10008119_26890 [Pedobacter mendelii]
MLVFIIAKKTGPVKNDEIIPAPIPNNMASNMHCVIYEYANMRFIDKHINFIFVALVA